MPSRSDCAILMPEAHTLNRQSLDSLDIYLSSTFCSVYHLHKALAVLVTSVTHLFPQSPRLAP